MYNSPLKRTAFHEAGNFWRNLDRLFNGNLNYFTVSGVEQCRALRAVYAKTLCDSLTGTNSFLWSIPRAKEKPARLHIDFSFSRDFCPQ
ncbi:hypothetical protein SBA6_40060 [Candidatus Sulfopaludibacter sp. SbA6]|nr:hypothetical protein SBA6_40060 [Candidatus Sulfopaludibacter sp. SbA6]